MAPPIDLHAVAVQAARQAGIDPNIFTRQINQESGFQVGARSSAGAGGVAQIVAKYHPDAPPPSDPVGQLHWAAKYMAGLVNKYGGSYAKALSVYNSGQPDKYLDPNFAGGQTYHYVKTIMGGTTPAASVPQAPAALAPILPPGGGTPPAPRGLSAGLLQAVNTGNEMFGLAPLPAALTSAPVAAPTLTAPPLKPLTQPVIPGAPVAPTTLKGLTMVPPRIATRGGIQVDKALLPTVSQIVRQFGVKVNSGYRSPTHNAQVGGAPSSDHLSGNAVDFTGSQENMRRLYAWAQTQPFKYLEPWDKAATGGVHVHISF